MGVTAVFQDEVDIHLNPKIGSCWMPEDKWFIYWENDTLFFHRSWTGVCVYIVRFTSPAGTPT